MWKNGEFPVTSSCDGNGLSDPVPPGDNVVKCTIKPRFMHASLTDPSAHCRQIRGPAHRNLQITECRVRITVYLTTLS